MHEDWLTTSAAELAAEGLEVEALRQERSRYSAAMQEASRLLFSEWLDGLEPRRTP
jgi:GMP synthase (glutamine-hydrolysing)